MKLRAKEKEERNLKRKKRREELEERRRQRALESSGGAASVGGGAGGDVDSASSTSRNSERLVYGVLDGKHVRNRRIVYASIELQVPSPGNECTVELHSSAFQGTEQNYAL